MFFVTSSKEELWLFKRDFHVSFSISINFLNSQKVFNRSITHCFFSKIFDIFFIIIKTIWFYSILIFNYPSDNKIIFVSSQWSSVEWIFCRIDFYLEKSCISFVVVAEIDIEFLIGNPWIVNQQASVICRSRWLL